MQDAIFRCLISRGEAYYSAFISYRVASEAPLAHLLFDELNHSVTPSGHRVTVYWDAHRLVKGEDWEEGFSAGLLSSLCFFPILSYGSTAPLAAFPENPSEREVLIGKSWEENPFGRRRLRGMVDDVQDNVLKEFLIAGTLLEERDGTRSAVTNELENERKGLLQLAYPILVGRQQPEGHPDYPKMGEYFDVQGGGGHFPNRPSEPTGLAVARFLQKFNFSDDAIQRALKQSVQDAVTLLTRIQGCKLWAHSEALKPVALTKEQLSLIGKGSAGPPVDLCGIVLTSAQV